MLMKQGALGIPLVPSQIPRNFLAEIDRPLAYSGGGDTLHHMLPSEYAVPHHNEHSHKRGQSDIGSSGASSMAEQLQRVLEENNAFQNRLTSCEVCRGQKAETRQAALQLQKAIGEKLAEALALHKALSGLL